jgi:hypothetical protein
MTLNLLALHGVAGSATRAAEVTYARGVWVRRHPEGNMKLRLGIKILSLMCWEVPGKTIMYLNIVRRVKESGTYPP